MMSWAFFHDQPRSDAVRPSLLMVSGSGTHVKFGEKTRAVRVMEMENDHSEIIQSLSILACMVVSLQFARHCIVLNRST